MILDPNMKWALLLSGIIELVGGIITYMKPTLLFVDQAGTHQFYGIALLVLGLINLLCFKFYEETGPTRSIYMAMMFFHAVVAILSYRTGGLNYQTGAIATHLGLFIIFFWFYMQNLKPALKDS